MEMTRIEVESKISAVTVYQGWAMISRTASLELAAGKHTLVFADLPASLDRDNIQVKGTGEATLGECIFETEFFVEDVNEKKRALQNKAQDLEDKRSEIKLNIDACESEKALIDKIVDFVTTPAGAPPTEGSGPAAPAGAALDVGAWQKMLAFYHDQHEEIRSRMLASQKAVREVERDLENVYTQLESLGDGVERSRNIIKVSVAKEKAGKITLDLSYVITGPSWRPVYSLRATSDSDTISVEYDALVNQATGEAWQDVALKLSTARVNVSGVMPELHPWRLAFYQPAPVMSMPRAKSRKAEANAPFEEAMKASASGIADDGMPEMEIDFPAASVESGGTSVVFVVGGGGTISGDNNSTRVSILRREFPASFRYAATPKLSEFAYLTGKINNDSEFPLLPGKANVFFDGAFVSVSQLSLVMPGQEMAVSLGVDEGIKIEHRFLRRFKKNQGLMAKRISEQFDYQIRITNNRKKDIEIEVVDQLPIAENKDITVKAISPSFKQEDAGITLDDESKIKWQVMLADGEKRELPLCFIVEYPAGSQLSGL
jgi:uncharacterized protein (TIGR02231 family)